MGKFIDLTGQRFGKLTVIKRVPAEGKHIKWECLCECGKVTVVMGLHLKDGHTKSCGCYQTDIGCTFERKTNKYIIKDNYVIGITTKGIEFLIDAEDYDNVKNICWHLSKTGYIVNRRSDNTRLHRFVMNAPSNKVVDHINRNPLDNRKSNLRVVTQSENGMNTKIPNDNTSGYKCVSFDKSRNKWVAQIGYKGNHIQLGRFQHIQDAIKARREAEKIYFGEYSSSQQY